MRWMLLAWVVVQGCAVSAEEVYLAPADFVAAAFNGTPPVPRRLWLKQREQAALRAILERDFGQLRVRYWQRDARTVWILEEIGKEQPITTGLVVEGQALADVRVLVYRESRGWEVKYPAFTDQFRGLKLTNDHLLTARIDGISGATLSVRALTKLARVALLLDSFVHPP